MNKECVFCKIISGSVKSEIVYESNLVLAFLDIDPINEGHILIIPKSHYLDLDEIPEETIHEMSILSKKIVKVIKDIYKPEGYSIMQNGGVFNDVGHYHLHVFPRYEDDGFGWTFSEKEHDFSFQVADVVREKLEEISESLD